VFATDLGLILSQMNPIHIIGVFPKHTF
jgi:hypothetical protein